ncbi:MAG: hypothetical protein COA61_007705 [Zetaproteobacteria bacterium]|nr:hypothetical protein [Zetaproteobacteria bacterium]
MMRWFSIATCALWLSACGYHLVGQGGISDIVPKDALALQVKMLAGDDARLLAVAEKSLVQRTSLPLLKQGDEATDGVLDIYIEHAQESMNATSFDASGVANQYRLTISGKMRVLYQGKERWQSGAVAVQGDVFATGGAVVIEAQRESVAKSLRRQWVQQALQRMYSGF